MVTLQNRYEIYYILHSPSMGMWVPIIAARGSFLGKIQEWGNPQKGGKHGFGLLQAGEETESEFATARVSAFTTLPA